jgi:hypothetical protein
VGILYDQQEGYLDARLVHRADGAYEGGGWAGLVNISLPGGEEGGGRLEALKAEIASPRPNVYSMHGVGSRGEAGGAFSVSSELELGSLATGEWPDGWGYDPGRAVDGRALESTSGDSADASLPEPIRFQARVTDLIGAGSDVSVSVGVHFTDGGLAADGAFFINGEGATTNASLEYGCLWVVPDDGVDMTECHSPLVINGLTQPHNLESLGWCVLQTALPTHARPGMWLQPCRP